ncbi:MAG: peptide chain release factor N(5)-glutamine methyltransferase [Acidobacteria bacterium]|nr:peptide chain release factor N(5)-glutamine methyltransferase [Acidobacteriota bacterium]
MTFHHHINSAKERLARAGIDAGEAALDAELLVRQVLGWTRAQLLIARHAPAPAGFAEPFEALVRRRERREPMAYILGHREFWNLEFEVTPAVLTPRPETELLVEQAIVCARLMGDPASDLQIVDAGTGSGCIVVSLARELPHAKFLATDVSAAALEVARRNARRHAVEGRIQFIETDGLPDLAGLTLVVSNPPYVPLKERDTLPSEVREYEPASALFAGPDGLEAIRRLLQDANAKIPSGFLLFEFGFGQEAAVRQLSSVLDRLRLARIVPDLQKIPRVAVLKT